MSEDTFNYKGFSGSVQYSADDDILVGKVLDIQSLIMYSGISVADLRAAFEEAVDDYLATCELNSTEPEKAYTGTFNVRIGAELHRAAAVAARRNGQKLNEFVTRSIASELSRSNRPVLHGGTVVRLSSVVAESHFSWDSIERGVASGEFAPDCDVPNLDAPSITTPRHATMRARSH